MDSLALIIGLFAANVKINCFGFCCGCIPTGISVTSSRAAKRGVRTIVCTPVVAAAKIRTLNS